MNVKRSLPEHLTIRSAYLCGRPGYAHDQMAPVNQAPRVEAAAILTLNCGFTGSRL